MRVILSPHIDDAALSLGGSLLKWRANGEACAIVNVFTETAFTTTAGATRDRGTEASRLRQEEETLIAAELGVQVIHLGYPDAGSRGYRAMPCVLNQFVRVNWERDRNLVKDVKGSLLSTLQQFPGFTLFVPLAPAGHQDHLVVHSIGRELQAQATNCMATVFYEDLPYCCRYTLARILAVRRLRLSSRCMEINLAEKLELVSRYRHSVKARWITEIDRYARKVGRDVPCERLWSSPRLS